MSKRRRKGRWHLSCDSSPSYTSSEEPLCHRSRGYNSVSASSSCPTCVEQSTHFASPVMTEVQTGPLKQLEPAKLATEQTSPAKQLTKPASPAAAQSPIKQPIASPVAHPQKKRKVDVKATPKGPDKFNPPTAEDMEKYRGIAQRAEIHARRQLGIISNETAEILLHSADCAEKQQFRQQMKQEMDKVGLGSLVDRLSAAADEADRMAQCAVMAAAQPPVSYCLMHSNVLMPTPVIAAPVMIIQQQAAPSPLFCAPQPEPQCLLITGPVINQAVPLGNAIVNMSTGAPVRPPLHLLF